MSKGPGEIQQKVLLLLGAGLALGLSHSPRVSFKILEGVSKEWKDIEKRALKRAINSLYKSKMVDMKYNKKTDTISVILSEEGKNRILTYDLDKMEIKIPKVWDGNWRVVLFDIPEVFKKRRESLRFRLKNLGFFEYQKSVFVHPYDCKNEIDYIIEFSGIRKYVRFIVAESLDNELHLKKHFGLL